MKFKVGDTVKILDRIGDEDSYSPIYTDYMLEKYAGTIATIKKISSAGTLELYNNEFYWDTKAVELVNKDKYLHPTELKDGDFIKIWGNINEYIYIFEEYQDGFIYRHVSFNLNNKTFNIQDRCKWAFNPYTDKITYATKEETNLLNITLLKEGYVWNNLTKELEGIQVTTLSDSSDLVTVNPIMDGSSAEIINYYPIKSNIKYGIPIDLTEEKVNKEELNLFPTKKHYQLNFNY